ncbi:MAG TPA: tetratricopeptide repeat protein [Acidobacteriaceae bacterium]|nr:tetratricopeptide repeat protein [Acidobacteriaceae bacterium]
MAGSGLTFLGAAATLGVATPEHWLAAASSSLLTGAGALFLNELHKSYHDQDDEEKARRNHLIRRGMARALRDALLDARTELAADLPSNLRESFFRYWPDLLHRAQTDDEAVELVFPLDRSEDQWNLLNRYSDDLQAAELAADPVERQARLYKRELQDQEALAALLCRFPLGNSHSRVIRLFTQTLQDRWSKEDSLALASRLLPRYRVFFAVIFSEDGPASRAIEYKSQKFTRRQLEEIQICVQAGIDSLSKQIAGISGQVSEVDAGVKGLTNKLDNLERQMTAMAALLAKRIASGEVPRGVVTPLNEEATIDEAVRQLPQVIEEIRESPSPVATANVEQLLAAGRLDEAAVLGQSQFDAAQQGYFERGRNFARACYDMGRINEMSFRWTAALENYRQAWTLSAQQNAKYGFKYAHFAASLNHHLEAIGVYEAILHRLADPADRAGTLNNLGSLYAHTQRYNDAGKAYIEALTLLREMTAANPAIYEPHVAMALNSLGLFYAKTQRRGDAQTAYTEALTLYRKLARINPAVYHPHAAMTINNLGMLYVDTQRHNHAQTAYTEALGLYRKLAAANPAAHEPSVAMTLNNLGLLYADTQRHNDAQTAYTEALGLYRKLAAANPAAHEPHVAMTLANFGLLYEKVQRHDDAETVYTEALKLRRRLATTNPNAYEPVVAGTLNNLGNLYGTTQRHLDAEEAFIEALALYHRLATTNPAVYEPHVAMTLNNLGVLYEDTERHADAETAYTEALTLRRKLAAINQSVYQPNVAGTLNNLGNLYVKTHRNAHAGEAYTESLTLYRKLAAANPAVHKPHIAMTLNNLGSLYADMQRPDDAGRVYIEALALYRKLAAANPAVYESNVATTLYNLGRLYANIRRPIDAEVAYTESLTLYRKLAAANPATHAVRLATTLNNLGALYWSTGKIESAEAISSEAERIATSCWKARPAAYADLLARALFLRAVFCSSSGNRAIALDYAHRALHIALDLQLRNQVEQFIKGLS